MADESFPAAAALVVGAVGLLVCWMITTHKMPTAPQNWWRQWKSSHHATPVPRPPEPSPQAAPPTRRRVITGAPAADRHGPRTRPGRHLSFRPDVLRQQRHRLGTAESQRVVEGMLDDDPERLAGMIEDLLAEDRDDPTRQQGAP